MVRHRSCACLAALVALVVAILLVVHCPQSAEAAVTSGIKLTVTDGSGAPIAGAEVAVYDPETDVYAEGAAGADGVCILEVPAGAYYVDVLADGYQEWFTDATTQVVDGVVTTLDVRLVRMSSVRVVVHSSSDVPVAGAAVAVYDPDTDEYAEGTTGADGVCVIEVPEGDYYIDVTSDGYEEWFSDSPVHVAGGSPTTVNVELSRSGHSISGDITDELGRPLVATTVTVVRYDPADGYWLWVADGVTDEAGHYEVLVDKQPVGGRYRIFSYMTIQYDRLYKLRYFSTAGPVESMADASDLPFDGTASVDGIDMVMPGQDPSLTFRVTDDAGTPLNLFAPPWVHFAAEPAVGDGPVDQVLDVRSGGTNGRVSIFDLPEGDYVLRTWASDAWRPSWYLGQDLRSRAMVIRVRRGETARLGDWPMLPHKTSIQGTVRLNGAPVPGLQLWSYKYFAPDDRWYSSSQCFTDDNGHYEFRDLEAGPYRVGAYETSLGTLTLYDAAFNGDVNRVEDAPTLQLEGGTIDGVDLTLRAVDSVADDEYEEDDERATARAVVWDSPAQRRTFGALGDQDWMQLYVTRGTTYTIATRSSPDHLRWSAISDPTLAIVDTDGTRVLASNYDYNPATWSRLEWTADADKLVYVRVTDLLGEIGAYEISFYRGVDAVTPFVETATPTTVLAGQNVSLMGSARDSLGHAIAEYRWTEGEAVLSTAPVFSSTALGVGSHTLAFQARCSDGVWSPRIATAVSVIELIPRSLTVPRVSGRPTAKKGTVIKGLLVPAHSARLTLEVQRLSKRKYRKYRTFAVTPTAAGAWTWKRKLKRGTYRVRVYVKAEPGYSAATSSWRKVVVR